jgi:tetratricopeptide (TPR) repeat protein
MKSLKNDNVLESCYDLIKELTHIQCESDRKHHQNGLEKFETYCARQEYAAVENAKNYAKECSIVLKLIVEELKNKHDEEAIREIAGGARHFLSEASKYARSDDKTMREMFSYSPELMGKIYHVGISFLEHNRNVDAIKVFSYLIMLDPGYASCWTMLGLSSKREKQWEASLIAFETALKIDSDNPLAYFHKAGCLAELGRSEEARKAYDKTLKVLPNHPEYAYLEKQVNIERRKL